MFADNKLALKAGWDREILVVELWGLIELDFEVELTGFGLTETELVLDDVGPDAVATPTPSIGTNSKTHMLLSKRPCSTK
ncbi:hypothetical protein DXH95_02510 [Sphingorhabdus pulchriflava]|uniref:Uncharacterized protein n=1 Tax=Sphingorhabdus pulchriflava TaxID=2292257 RepID=A0A371BFP2_9SPHN|nr:hypothetical protein [Sphingorhabdus pulchriflava]RDV06327.1 hypothetical protein DXH95_02510 [Sphingorhabdus pulchriflava]